MRKTYFVATVRNEVVDRFSYAFAENNYYNLDFFCKPQRDGEIEYLCVCDTKADAVKTASDWNANWGRDGHLWIDAPMYYRAIF